MFESVFDLPLLIVGIAIVATLCIFAVVGLMVVRRLVLPRLSVQSSDSEFTGAMLQSVMVFYGLAVALIAVSVWQTYSDTSKVVSEEATTLAALYRDVSGYPDSVRPTLQNELRDYTHQIIYEAWPAQQRREVPKAGVSLMNNFQATLFSFEPTTETQKLLHAETLSAYNQLIHARRLRLDAVHTGLPGVMWAVIILGAFIGLSASFFFRVQSPWLHIIEVLLLSTFIGLIIFMILVLDRPFRGDLGIPPDSYQLIYDQLMKP
jgi:hypothetical protein